LGSINGLLVRKLVKPTKVFSRTPNQGRVHQFLSAQAQTDIGTRGARVLRKPDTAVRQELSRLDPSDRVFYQFAEFLPLGVCNGGVKVLDLNQPFPHKDDLGNVGDPGDPAVTDQLRV
jgi:hypothetical protein